MKKKIFVLIIGFCITGCWNPFKPAVSKTGLGGLSEEERLLLDLQYSYNNKDILRYIALLSDSFIFQFAAIDSAFLKSKNIILPYWGKGEEENSARGLFQETDKIELRIDAGEWKTWAGDPSGNSRVTRRPYNLSISPALPEFQNARGFGTFIIRKNTLGRYQILRWIDEPLF